MMCILMDSSNIVVMISLPQVILLLGNGLDAPPRKFFFERSFSRVIEGPSSDSCSQQEEVINQPEVPEGFSLRPVIYFLLWVSLFSVYLLLLCGVSLKQLGGLWEMFRRFKLFYFEFSYFINVCLRFAFLIPE